MIIVAEIRVVLKMCVLSYICSSSCCDDDTKWCFVETCVALYFPLFVTHSNVHAPHKRTTSSTPKMTPESDKKGQQEHVVVAQYQDLLAKLSPDEAFFEMANSPIVSFRIDSSSTVSDEVIRVEQKQELENSCGGIVWESAFALAEHLRKRVVKNQKQKTAFASALRSVTHLTTCSRSGKQLPPHPTPIGSVRLSRHAACGTNGSYKHQQTRLIASAASSHVAKMMCPAAARP